MDDRAAEVEREERGLAAERDRSSSESDMIRGRWERAETRAAGLRDEVDRLARLLIDAGPAAEAEPGQAA